MNYLAHAYLSFKNEDLLIGNMISDFIKGKKQYDYSPGIFKGIRLHRDIDTFTDNHPTTKAARVFLKPAVGLYSGAFVDVIYDHFLANDQNEFTNVSLEKFAKDTYDTLTKFNSLLPAKFQMMLPYMKEHNWLYNYKSVWGIEQSFGGVVRRAKYIESSKEAFAAFEKHYIPLQKCYSEFFPDLKQYTAQQL
jgi:acyl carrier protein phosphodiesterase